MSWLPRASLMLLGVLLVAQLGCEPAPPPERTWTEGEGHRWATLTVPRSGTPGFTPRAATATGLDFTNAITQEEFLANRHTINGSGVAIGDVDGDGWADVYLAQLSGPNVLYRNLGGDGQPWQFADITAEAGVAAPDRYSTGATLADLDGDGDLDLVVTAMGGPNAVYTNDGTGVFAESTAQWGLSDAGWGSTTVALSDVEGDGDLDLYLSNYKRHTVKDLYPPFERAFSQTVVQEADSFLVLPPFDEHYALIRQPTRLMRFETGEPDVFYEQVSAGRFEAVPWTSGRFVDATGAPLTSAPEDWALVARFQDLTGDGVPDLYVCNDFESPDAIWVGDGAGGFRALAPLAVRRTSNSTMSIASGDINRDGVVDLFTADMLSANYTRRRTQIGTRAPSLAQIGDIENRPQEMQNSLLLGRGDGTFAEIAQMAGVAASEWTWASTFVDVDLDGYEDLLVTNGHHYDAMDSDTQERIANTHAGANWREALLEFPPLDLQNMAFRNLGEDPPRFEAMPDGWGLGQEADVSHGLALGDLDHDGDLDAVVNRLGRPALVLENTSAAPRVAVRLRGAGGNTQGAGAQVTYRPPAEAGVPVQQAEMVVGGQYLSSSAAEVVFAAGSSTSGVAGGETSSGTVAGGVLEVRWRSGQVSRVEGVRPNRLYELYEPTSGTSAPTMALRGESDTSSDPSDASTD